MIVQSTIRHCFKGWLGEDSMLLSFTSDKTAFSEWVTNHQLYLCCMFQQGYEEHGEKTWFGCANDDNGSCENTRGAVAEGQH